MKLQNPLMLMTTLTFLYAITGKRKLGVIENKLTGDEPVLGGQPSSQLTGMEPQLGGKHISFEIKPRYWSGPADAYIQIECNVCEEGQLKIPMDFSYISGVVSAFIMCPNCNAIWDVTIWPINNMYAIQGHVVNTVIPSRDKIYFGPIAVKPQIPEDDID